MGTASFDLKTIPEGIVGAIKIAGTILFAPILRSRYSRWGANTPEITRALPGDEIVPKPQSEITNAITISGRIEEVWAWLVQIGCQRGGWYAYDWLDNGGVPSANRIYPEYQNLQVGDMVAAVPNGKIGFPVAILEPNKVLSLAGILNTQTGLPADPKMLPPQYFAGDQTFYLDQIDSRATRLIFRMRMGWNNSFLNNLIYRGVVEPISAVMGQKMLQTLKRRIESKPNAGMK